MFSLVQSSVATVRSSRLDKRQRQLLRDLRVLARFILTYCDSLHPAAERSPVELKCEDPAALLGAPVRLCPECAKLLAHAFTKRIHCPMEPKPACKHCPQHCYHPRYRAAIR